MPRMTTVDEKLGHSRPVSKAELMALMICGPSLFGKHFSADPLRLLSRDFDRDGKKAKVKWRTYLLICGDESLYCGVTVNMVERLKTHNAGKGGAYTRSHLPVRVGLVSRETSQTCAMQLEARIKSCRTPQEKVDTFSDYVDIEFTNAVRGR
jgi:putative endonuclease